ncbi:MAG: metal ABC transporter permease [Bifidobacteriaceae bacterium]|jgi:zinc transport system permease protein|nr:metal ABC transporter permease [Bifidobacteriaceae bacterium]
MSGYADYWIQMLQDPLIRRALLVAVLVGAAAPVIGTFLVQRRLALLGDGIGHVALTGVALGWLIGAGLGLTPGTLAVPGAIVAAVAGSVIIELVRTSGRTSGDLALALMFYGGIAGGAALIKVAGGTSATLVAYLFGSLSTLSASDVSATAELAVIILMAGLVGRWALFAAGSDEPFARASGIPTRLWNIASAALAALTVTVAMRVVGLLLVSALMIVPVAISQLAARSFARTMAWAALIGAVTGAAGLFTAYWYDLPPGATIVVLAIAIYAIAATSRPLVEKLAHRPSHLTGQPRS